MRGVSNFAVGVLSTLSVVTIYGLSACSPSTGTDRRTIAQGGDSGGTQGFGDGGATSFGGDVTGLGNTTGNNAGTTSGGGQGGSCSSDIHQGERLPLDMYFIVDSSGSMGEKVTGGTKWSTVSSALTAFLNDPANADIGTGIGWFPVIKAGAPALCSVDADCKPNGQDFGACQGVNIPFLGCVFCSCSLADGCDVPTYAAPSVPVSLPPNHPAVVSDIAAHNPGGGTPTRPALEGGLTYANSWAAAHPGRTTVVVLATDGDPSGCGANSVQDVANTAASGLSGPNHIRTYVIGVGSSLNALNQVAAAGGTDHAFVLDTAGDVAKSFADALAAIHGSAVPCDFKVPATTSDGQKINPKTVNVTIVEPGGGPQSVLQTFSGAVDTCNDGLGWYYDDPAAPTLLKMCPSTCSKLALGGSIQVDLSCKQTERAPR